MKDKRKGWLWWPKESSAQAGAFFESAQLDPVRVSSWFFFQRLSLQVGYLDMGQGQI